MRHFKLEAKIKNKTRAALKHLHAIKKLRIQQLLMLQTTTTNKKEALI